MFATLGGHICVGRWPVMRAEVMFHYVRRPIRGRTGAFWHCLIRVGGALCFAWDQKVMRRRIDSHTLVPFSSDLMLHHTFHGNITLHEHIIRLNLLAALKGIHLCSGWWGRATLKKNLGFISSFVFLYVILWPVEKRETKSRLCTALKLDHLMLFCLFWEFSKSKKQESEIA